MSLRLRAEPLSCVDQPLATHPTILLPAPPPEVRENDRIIGLWLQQPQMTRTEMTGQLILIW